MHGNSGIALTTFTNAGSENLLVAHHSAWHILVVNRSSDGRQHIDWTAESLVVRLEQAPVTLSERTTLSRLSVGLPTISAGAFLFECAH